MNVLIDLTALAVIGLLLAATNPSTRPTKLGFFCDDPSIRYPFKTETISGVQVYAISILIPVVVGYVFQNPYHLNPLCRSFWTRFYKCTYPFVFGGGINITLMNLVKFSFGRLRPHFMDVCRPAIYFNRSNCGDHPHYITDYQCTGQDRSEIYLSFFSGHSMGISYAMVYLCIVFERTMPGRKLAPVRLGLQAMAIFFALWLAMTRLTDYWHHYTDVLFGLLFGATSSILHYYSFSRT